jgi:prepilin-type N-terminal cleavage/methylation domain-containing protein
LLAFETRLEHRGSRFAGRLRRRLAGERGFTLIELLVATTLALVVLAPVVALFAYTQKDTTGVVTKADATASAQAGLNSMDSELRQAYAVEFPTSSDNSGCTTSGGVQSCNQADVLVRSSGSDVEFGYVCTVASTTITGDRSCWAYECLAPGEVPASSTCTSASGSQLISSQLVIDDITNGTSGSPVFAFCYPNSATTGSACASGASRPTSVDVAIDTPAAGTLTSAEGGDASTIALTDDVYMTNLGFGQ